MNNDYKKLLKATEHQCKLQEKIIANQEKQISELTRKNEELFLAYEHATEICIKQQELLDSVFNEENN
ncbi:hypothetical protein LJC51_06880 [Lachnospiraceae bacterium OttesenSCG-928-J05]|nr:hypothetical protein [Lachnospiraceae bacterium OttesenSCG-928-J05]